MRKFSTYNGLFLGKPPIIKDNSNQTKANYPATADNITLAPPNIANDYMADSDNTTSEMPPNTPSYPNDSSDSDVPQRLSKKALGCLTTMREHDRAIKALLSKQ